MALEQLNRTGALVLTASAAIVAMVNGPTWLMKASGNGCPKTHPEAVTKVVTRFLANNRDSP